MADDLMAGRWPPAGGPGAPRPPAGRGAGRRGRLLTRAAGAAALCAAACGLFALYLLQSRTAPFNSDGAANVLQGQAIIAGNPLLRGWWTSDVSFYTTELPEYALVTAVRGLTPGVVHVCGALSYTLAVLLAFLLARSGGGWRRGALAAGIMLAPGLLGGTEVFLENPDHAGTAVPVLLVLLVVACADRPPPPRLAPPGNPPGNAPGTLSGGRVAARLTGRWLRPALVCALLALAQVGDELTLVALVAPLAAVCALRVAAGRRPRPCPARSLPARSLPDGALLAAAVASAGLARLAGTLLRSLGGFDVRPLGGVRLALPRQVPASAGVLGRSLLLLFGANGPGTPHQPRMARAHPVLVVLADLHLIGLILAVLGLLAGIAAILARRADRVTQVLVAAVAAVLAAGAFTTVLRSLSNAHEIAVLLPLAAVLAGRTLPGAAVRLTAGWRALPAAGRWLAPAALVAWLALGLAQLCYAAAWPGAPPAQQAVASWLAAHHQRAGLAGYWQADATTVTSGGRVLVAPVTVGAPAARGPGAPRASADRWESSAGWYQPGRHDATFVIAVTGPGAPGGLSPAQVRASFGPPSAVHRVGREVLMIYRYNLLTRLHGTAFPGPG